MNAAAALVAGLVHVQPASVQVGVAPITPNGVEVEIACRLDGRFAADEQADKTALMLGMLRLAGRMRIRLGSAEPAAAPPARAA